MGFLFEGIKSLLYICRVKLEDMKYTVNKNTKTIELHSGIISYDNIKGLLEQFKDYSFLICSPKIEKQGMVVGEKYIPLIGNISHS
jgi:hypothetical protein